jgi:predicted aspartyl protease
MEGGPFLVDVQFNGVHFAKALVDSGCLCYATISETFANSLDLPRIEISPRTLDGVIANQGRITHITWATIDVHGQRQSPVYFYVIKGQMDDVILGDNWMKDVDARYSPRKGYMDITCPRTGVKTRCWNRAKPTLGPQGFKRIQITRVRAEALLAEAQHSRTQVCAVTMADIEKALRPKPPTNVRAKLPPQYHRWLPLFDQKKAEELPSHRPGIDHTIPLEKDQNGQEKPPPWGPLYGMNREELLVLRKTLTDLLGKDFIRASRSPAAAPVLLVRKPGGGIRFCVDYRGLNALTVKDRYPLPLIKETLRNMSKARWFTKLDVIAAFHKIRMAPGEEWKTAFRTRYGLFEWRVMPFGLTGAPATFQRYVNHVLREYLDDFASAYIDDIIIYSDGSLEDHRRKVQQVLEKLLEANLQCDINKSEFEVHSVRYLGFIVKAGEGITVDPEKVDAIRAWSVPDSVRAVRSFLGFANFYRPFIPNFADLARPLTALTKKDAIFRWNDDCQDAFDTLKERFITAPILAHFDPERETVVEADASGYATGGVLLQRGADGALQPCAYLSQRLSPAETNYEIHDKELLAIVRAMRSRCSSLIGWPGCLRGGIVSHAGLGLLLPLPVAVLFSAI